MKKDILLIANYWHFENEKASSRYRSFADILCKNYDLEVITSTFCHIKKYQRKSEELQIDTLPYKVTLCYEKGYKKNISLKRIASYTQFGKNVLAYLKKRKKADLIIVSVPSLAVADYVSKYANDNNIPLIVDIQDLWPEAFRMAINIPVISDLLFAPMMRQANRIYSRADEIMAVSDTYVERGLKFNNKAKGLSVYLGTDSDLIKEKTRGVSVESNEDKFVIGYVGALGSSYDIKLVIDAIKILKEKGYSDIQFKVMGDGVLRNEFESYAKKSGIDCIFTGLLEYGVMMKTLTQCDVAVNPIVGRSVSSIINKVSDYAAAGVPVVNSQNSEEYRQLLHDYDAGINVPSGNATAFAEAIETYYLKPEVKKEAGQNQLRMFNDLFDRKNIYPKLIETIEMMTDGKV